MPWHATQHHPNLQQVAHDSQFPQHLPGKQKGDQLGQQRYIKKIPGKKKNQLDNKAT